MDELRKSPRIAPDEEIHVIDRGDNRRIGVMVNLSAGGLMISGDQPIITNRLYQLRLEWATSVDGKNDIHLGADALWPRVVDARDRQAAQRRRSGRRLRRRPLGPAPRSVSKRQRTLSLAFFVDC